ncbi:MAG: MarR family winged helix-turn-helix transcriptional regulator [Burkholderiaceae bacterium]
MNKHPAKQAELIALQRELGQTIGDVSRAWRYEMNLRLKPFGLNLSMRQVLVLLHRHPEGLVQKQLARKLGIEEPTLARLLDQLEKKEWIIRIPSQDDKRCKYSKLTSKASEQIQIIEKLSRQLRREMMQGLDEAEMETALRILSCMRDNLHAL